MPAIHVVKETSAPLQKDVQISLSGVRKYFGRSGFVALDGISIDIPKGEFFVIVGPSGCGKTTLLRILAGLERQSEGGVDIAQFERLRPANSMIFQGDSLFPWMSVYDNAAYGLRMRHVDKAEIAETVRVWLERIGLWRFRDLYPHQLSGGMRQRVSIVRAFANDPEILLMDEPFSSLDAQTREIMQTELMRIWEEGRKTVLFVTHQIDEAVFLADRVLVFARRPGRLRENVEIDLPRPRALAIKRTAEFVRYVDHIWRLIEDDVRASVIEEKV